MADDGEKTRKPDWVSRSSLRTGVTASRWRASRAVPSMASGSWRGRARAAGTGPRASSTPRQRLACPLCGGGGLKPRSPGEQIRRARELLGWTPYRLAPRAGIGHTLLRQFERGARPIDAESAARLRAALEEAGVEFLGNGEDVRLRVCNGATVEFTDGEPLDPSARNPA